MITSSQVFEPQLQDTDGLSLYKEFAAPMADDYVRQFYGPDYGSPEQKTPDDAYDAFIEHFPLAEARLRIAIEADLDSNKSLEQYGIPSLTDDDRRKVDDALQHRNTARQHARQPRVLREQLYNIDRRQQRDAADARRIMMNKFPEQAQFYDTVCDSRVDYGRRRHFFFLDAPGGTGKTFLFNAILEDTRADGKVALAVASSGIAALLLELGRTMHSRFKAPIDGDFERDDGGVPSFVSKIGSHSTDAELLRLADLIV